MNNVPLKIPQISSDISDMAPVFARHETFHPRYGWLKKGYDAVCADPGIFRREDAPVFLGVGKNMVRAIKYWCLAFKVVNESFETGEGRGFLAPTEFGNLIFSEPNGLDPFVEEAATLWLLHYKFLSMPCHATAWYYIFNLLPRNEFTTSDLFIGLSGFVKDTYTNNRLAQSSLKKDVSCIIRMYCDNEDGSLIEEESIDSPFSQLGLMKHDTEKGYYRFSIGKKISLPPDVITYCCLQFVNQHFEGVRTISMSSLLYLPGSPGQVLKLDEQTLYNAIEASVAQMENLTLSETAGLVQLSIRDKPIEMARHILTLYYQGLKR